MGYTDRILNIFTLPPLHQILVCRQPDSMLVRRLSGDRLSVTVATTPLSQRSTVMYFVCEFGVLLVELEKWPLWNEVALGLDYWLMSWPVTAYFSIYDHWKLQQARHFRARSEWLNMTKVGGRNESLSKVWLFPSMQCSRDVENWGKARMHLNKRLYLGPGNEREQKHTLLIS